MFKYSPSCCSGGEPVWAYWTNELLYCTHFNFYKLFFCSKWSSRCMFINQMKDMNKNIEPLCLNHFRNVKRKDLIIMVKLRNDTTGRIDAIYPSTLLPGFATKISGFTGDRTFSIVLGYYCHQIVILFSAPPHCLQVFSLGMKHKVYQN